MAWDEYEEEEDEDDEEDRFIVGIGMPMGTPDSDETFTAICDECERAQFQPLRVDLIVGSAAITKKFKAIVKQASVMILDLTGLREAVLREVGYVEHAHSEDYTILIGRAGTPLPAGIAERSVLMYKSTEHLRSLLRSQLETMHTALVNADEEDDDDDDDDNTEDD